MKKMMLLLSCVVLIAITSNAQDSTARKTKKERIHNMDSTQKKNLKEKGVTVENMKELDLSKDQQKQIADVHTNARQEKEKIKNDASLTPEQKQEKLKQIDKDSKTKVNGVLTDEQKGKMKKKRAKLKEKDPQ